MFGMVECPVCKTPAIVIPLHVQSPNDDKRPGVLLEGDDWSQGCGSCRQVTKTSSDGSPDLTGRTSHPKSQRPSPSS